MECRGNVTMFQSWLQTQQNILISCTYLVRLAAAPICGGEAGVLEDAWWAGGPGGGVLPQLEGGELHDGGLVAQICVAGVAILGVSCLREGQRDTTVVLQPMGFQHCNAPLDDSDSSHAKG